MGTRAVRYSWLVLVAGLAALVAGVGLSLADGVDCADVETRAGNKCLTYGDGIARSLDGPGTAGDPAAPVTLGLGGLLAAVGVWLVFFADRSVRPVTGVGDRIELARRYGWRFADVDRELLADWADTPDFGAGQPAYAVLHGSFQGLEFVVFDFRRPVSGTAGTAWVVYLPHPSRTFVEWATTQQSLYRRPLYKVGVRADAIVDIGREQHRSTEPDAILRQVRALAEIVARFEARAAGPSPRT